MPPRRDRLVENLLTEFKEGIVFFVTHDATSGRGGPCTGYCAAEPTGGGRRVKEALQRAYLSLTMLDNETRR